MFVSFFLFYFFGALASYVDSVPKNGGCWVFFVKYCWRIFIFFFNWDVDYTINYLFIDIIYGSIRGNILHCWHQWEPVIGSSNICTSPPKSFMFKH